jgi:hypothetical protein
MIGKSVAKMFRGRGASMAMGALGVGAVAQGLYSGANTGGQLTNSYLDMTLGSQDIDNAYFGEDIGLMSDLRRSTLGAQVGVSKQVGRVAGGFTGGLIGGGTAYGIGAALSKSNNIVGKTLGMGMKTLGVAAGATAGVGIGATTGYIAGGVMPVRGYAAGPLGEEFASRATASRYKMNDTGMYVRNRMPSVSGDVVFGAYNQRHA